MGKTAGIFRLLFLIIILTANHFAFSQEEEIAKEETITKEADKRPINLTELTKMMRADEKETVISDYIIVPSAQDKDLMVAKVFFHLYEINPEGAPTKKLYFYNCTFKIDKDSPLLFTNWNFLKINMVGCEFFNSVNFENIQVTGKYPFLIENCIFHDEIKIMGKTSEPAKLKLENNVFNAELLVDMGLKNLTVDHCRFLADSSMFLSKDKEATQYQFVVGDQPVGEVELTSNEFNNRGLTNVFSINFGSVSFGELKMISNNLNTLNLSGAEVAKALLIDSLFVSNYIGILNFDFPDNNTNAPWYNLSGEKFALFNKEKSGMIIPYQAKTDKQLADNLMYNDLMSAYNKFNTLYHDRGDNTSANASYVEIKNIETRKQAFIQKVHPTFNNLINYKLNVFLRFFSDYATNPGKSLIQSLWVILLFTVLYMFSFSRWDSMDYGFFLNQYSLFSKYIKNDMPVKEVYPKKVNPHENELNDLSTEYLANDKKVPHILKLLGRPLHFLGKFQYDIIPNLIRFFDFQPKKWSGLETGEKAWSGFLIFLISFAFILYVLIVKFFNSFVLSLNNFVVIGFGSSPEENERFAMYLSIIEGIIGWFLLTIFTITLLSQVLQNT